MQAPGVTVDKWLPLGRGQFSDEDGCGGGFGEVHVKLTYWPFELMRGHTGAARRGWCCGLHVRATSDTNMCVRQAGEVTVPECLRPVAAAVAGQLWAFIEAPASHPALACHSAEARVGAVIVTLLRCNDLPPADLPLGTSDPFVEFTLNKARGCLWIPCCRVVALDCLSRSHACALASSCLLLIAEPATLIQAPCPPRLLPHRSYFALQPQRAAGRRGDQHVHVQ